MIIIVDTNILISACLNQDSEIFTILTTLSQKIDFVVADYALEEIAKHKSFICKNTGQDIIIFDTLLQQCCNNAITIAVAEIATIYFKLAEQLTRDID